MRLRRLQVFSLLALVLFSACTRSASSPLETPGGTALLRVTQTPSSTPPGVPDSGALNPSASSTATIPLPSGTPLPDWQGIPIMPGALAGQDDDYQYRYTIEQDILAVQNYYKAELPKLGWSFDQSGTGYQGESLLTFKKGGKVLGVSLAILSLQDDLLFVTLAFP